MEKKSRISGIPQTAGSKQRRLHLAILKQMVTLSSSGLGLVAALAWNNVIQEFVNEYIKRYFSSGSSIISLLIYAILITILAVTVTYNLTRLTERLESLEDRIKNKT